ncbi:ATP-binding cassette domain-containing protein [Prosthecobacter vanneervenii]|uniref:ABC-type multidrug transport system ATPase subunit/ABC-type multidrug transport system permease subunit n=1 Tax=Prosthecobacter vanneervenii TaxID=48466 RepID=A0A7W7Y6X0_9BACT|nr:ABC transporter permease [Prosthecobacter vanneervenii]MBB5030552.1 ABC-type multidrug transport system ATPase subunit/ABC-type multidrug transport system permease subunit [Prosthecobacter vanneervenii]
MSLVKKLAKKYASATKNLVGAAHGGQAQELPWWSPDRWAHLWNGQPPISSAAAATANTMLPVLIEVFAAFSKLDGNIEEEEVESSLGYLRYDYPEAIYADMRRLYFEALQEPQDLTQRAKELSHKLTQEQKILLGVQLYLLISRAQQNQRQMVEFYLFMTNLGIAAQAIDIVYQLNAGDKPPEEGFSSKGGQPLDTLRVGATKNCDVLLRSLSDDCSVVAFRFQNLVLLKNTGNISILVRSRMQPPGEFSRLYPGERVVLEDVTLDYNDLITYFNAKKTLSGTQIYLTLTESGSAEIAPQRTRGTNLRLSFGLGVTVEALRTTKATLNGVLLTSGTVVEASIEDSIIAHGEVEIALRDLRVRAQEFGGQFRLEGSRNTYLVSNKPELLDEGDILLSEDTDGEILLRIECNYAQKTGVLEVLRSSRPLYIGTIPVRDRINLNDGDTITLGEGQYLRCHFADRIIEEERNTIRQLEVRELSHRFDARDTAQDGVSFIARRGEMICVMGPSGCGKSTLLRILGGQLKPKGGEVLMNGLALYDNLHNLTPYIAYIPQEDAFDPLLKVQENLDFSVSVRCPHLKTDERRKRVDAKLAELGLGDLSDRLAGTPQQKFLSGGERKRLNAGLDMIGISDVYLFDEPTSGLSSKDSEHVLEIIRSLARNKIVITSIHQPSSRLLQMFDKALLLDKGGKIAYFGTPQGMIEYFWRVYHTETGQTGDAEAHPPDKLTPDFVFDVLETPLRDISGDIIHERSADGHLVAARRFPPNFWRDSYQRHLIMESMARQKAAPGSTSLIARPKRDESHSASRLRHAPKPPKHTFREESILFYTLLKRAFLSKLRNRTNLLTTLLEAPLLAWLISNVLKYSEEKHYTFATAFHIPTYLFMSLVVAMFLGLTNSADEIIRDRHTLSRERNHNLRTLYYLFGKIISLSTFALIQCVIYLIIGNWVLEIRDMFFIHLWWMFLTSLTGVCLGLFISSIVSDNRTAVNAIPLILIPQIILGGALIKYEEMNKNLDFVYSVGKWLKKSGNDEDEASKLKVPFICQFMPLRWSYEGMVISQSKLNPLTRNQDFLDERIQSLLPPSGADMSDRQRHELELTKQSLAVVSGLYAENPREISKRLGSIRDAVLSGRIEPPMLDRMLEQNDGVSAEEIYVNRKVLDLVTKAEMEREDYRRKASPNVFFGTRKTYLGTKYNTLWINSIVILFTLSLIIAAVELSLRRQLTKV